MANISNYLEEALLNHVFLNIAYDRPGATIYIAIFESTKDPDELEANNRTGEIVGYTGTDRPGTAFDEATPTFQVAGKATVVSAADVDFLVMPAVTVGYIAAMDAQGHAAGNILYWAPVTPNKTTNAGDTLRFPAGDIVFDLD